MSPKEKIKKQLSGLSSEEQVTFIKEVYKKRITGSVYPLARFLGYNLICKQAHREIISVLDSENKRKLVVSPRGTFKSTLATTVYPIMLLLRNPNLRILIDTELYTNSTKYLRVIRGHLCNERLIELFGEFESNHWQEGEITIGQRTDSNLKEPTITCGAIGTTKVGMHYDVIIADDYNSPRNSETPEKCQKIIDHFRYNLSILEPGGEYAIIGTRYAEKDLIGFVLSDLLELKLLADGELERFERIASNITM